jgi:hypothetical protein
MATVQQNAQNHGLFVTNTSDTNGVFEDAERWYATWRAGGKPKRKSFSSSKYGEKRAKALAISYRQMKEEELQFNVFEPPAPSPQLKRPAPARSPDDVETKERPEKKQRLLEEFLIPKSD